MSKSPTLRINKKCFNLTQQIFFSQRLSLLLNSGISIVEALSMMKNIELNKMRRAVYSRLITDIEQGISLSKSIKTLELDFNSLLIAFVSNGESGGYLVEALSQAYHYLEKKNEMKKKIISSLIYPAFIVLATTAMTLFLILYIFPKIIPLLSSMDIRLPLMTRIVQGMYFLILHYGIYIIFLCIIVYVICYILIKKIPSIKYNFHLLIVSIPFIHSHIKVYLISSFCSTGEMLLSTGKGMPDLLIFSRDSFVNMVYKKIFDELNHESIQGITFSQSLIRYKKFFPQLLIDMSALGERTGGLSIMFGHCSRIFEQDIDNLLRRFSSLIEPVLMVLMGLIVGSIALSIILPVYEITNHLSK